MTRIDEQKMKMEEREDIDDIPTRIEMIQSDPISDIPTRIEMIRSEPISTSDCKKHEPKVNSDPDPPPSDSSDSSSSDSEHKRKKRKDKKKRRKHRKYDFSDPSSSDDYDDSDSSEESIYRRRRRNNKKHRKKDLIRLCATLTAKLLTTAFKSKMIRLKLDEDPLQRQIFFSPLLTHLTLFSQNIEKLMKCSEIIQNWRGKI